MNKSVSESKKSCSDNDSTTFALPQIILFAFNQLMLKQTLDNSKERQAAKIIQLIIC